MKTFFSSSIWKSLPGFYKHLTALILYLPYKFWQHSFLLKLLIHCYQFSYCSLSALNLLLRISILFKQNFSSPLCLKATCWWWTSRKSETLILFFKPTSFTSTKETSAVQKGKEEEAHVMLLKNRKELTENLTEQKNLKVRWCTLVFYVYTLGVDLRLHWRLKWKKNLVRNLMKMKF